MALFGVADWIVLAATICATLYFYLTRHRNYWKNQNVPYETMSLILRPLYRTFIKPVDLPDQDRYQKYGRLSGFFEAAKPSLIVAEPELVKQVLVKDFNLLPNRMEIDFGDSVVNNMMVMAHVERWRKIRPACSPAFTTGKLRKMHHLIEGCVKVTCNHLEAAAENSKDADMKQVYSHYALDVIARCAFGTIVDSHTDTANQFVMAAQKALGMGFSPLQILSMLFPGLLKTLRIKEKTAAPFMYFKRLFQQIMDERKQKNKRAEDFLQLMIDAKEGHFTATTENSTDVESQLFNMGSEVKGEAKILNALTEDEALAQCVVFFLAGQDTTSSTLAAAAYYLALNPDVQEKLRTEADECFATYGPEPSLDTISKLNYLHCVVSETLRMLPPVPRTQRCAFDDYVLAGTGIKLPKGSAAVIPIYAMHHDPEYFPEPELFNPDRFSKENVGSIRPYTYLPFGAGPRNCIGMRLALLSIKLCLLRSVYRVQFVRTEDTKVPLLIKDGLRGTLNVEGTVVGLQRRSST